MELGAPVTDENGELVRRGFAAANADGQSGTELSQAAQLGTRIGYSTAGLVIGSRTFCEEQFQRYRHAFGPKRRTDARPLRDGNWGGLCAANRHGSVLRLPLPRGTASASNSQAG